MFHLLLKFEKIKYVNLFLVINNLIFFFFFFFFFFFTYKGISKTN